jgi:uncharacterized protein
VTTIVAIAKEPRPGRVKTRLCPPCTLEAAAAIASAALRDTLTAVAESRCSSRVLALDGEPGAWLPPGFTIVPQPASDFGTRLAAAVDVTTGPVLLVGMDTPQLTPALLDRACGQLHEPGIDAVMGRADDGGYWAIGFRGRRHGAFVGVPMSTSETATRQLDRLRELGLRVGELPRLRDVDTFADARSVARQVPGSQFANAVAGAVAAIEAAA